MGNVPIVDLFASKEKWRFRTQIIMVCWIQKVRKNVGHNLHVTELCSIFFQTLLILTEIYFGKC
jgi:hypothetical protein